jgi:hypothetical protein
MSGAIPQLPRYAFMAWCSVEKKKAQGQFKRDVDGSWRKLHNDELHSLHSSLNIVTVIKSRRLRWAGHVACMGRGEVFTGFWLGGPKVRDHWEDLGVGGRMTLRWTLGR